MIYSTFLSRNFSRLLATLQRLNHLVGSGLCSRRLQSPLPTKNTCELPQAVRSQEEKRPE